MEDENKKVTKSSSSLPQWLDDDSDNEHDDNDDENENDSCSKKRESSKGPARARILLSSLASLYIHKEDLSPLEGLGPDVSALVLQHLSVQEISFAATVSKAMYQAARNPDLWKWKFKARWNYCESSSSSSSEKKKKNDPNRMDWFYSYQQAYQNTHDLWITHWNCVDPCDGLGPGRCCIQNRTTTATAGSATAESASASHLCPTCRYHPSIPNPTSTSTSSTSSTTTTAICTTAQAIAAATNLRLQQFPLPIFHDPTKKTCCYCPRRARRAFFDSSTLHRRISTQQYQSQSLFFLSDLLFFQVHDDDGLATATSNANSSNSKHQQELNDMKYLFPAAAEHHRRQFQDGSETALHSWHLVHFTNPDYNRPLVWRISIQRPDCFTVFPSEGYLQPGESRVVVFGVKPLASLLSHATQQLNAHREGVDEFWANVYTEEAHLPPSPFLIHYHYASVIPCRRAEDDNHHTHPPNNNNNGRTTTGGGGHNNHNNNNNAIHNQNGRAHPLHPHRHPLQSTNRDQHHHHPSNNNHNNNNHVDDETPWQRSAQPQQPVRTMYLSAHVNVNHSLREFRRSTLVPFSVRDKRTLVVCAPQLMESYPNVWKRLEHLDLEEEEQQQQQQPRSASAASSSSIHTINLHAQTRAYRTESACEACGESWGARREELGQAFVLAKLECELEKHRRDGSFQRIHRVLIQLLLRHPSDELRKDDDEKKSRSNADANANLWSERHHQLCYGIHKRLVDYRGAPWLTQRQREVLLQWEAVTDQLCLQNNATTSTTKSTSTSGGVEDYGLTPWRHAGVYKHIQCTDSVFVDDDSPRLMVGNTYTNTNDDDADDHETLWKDEPQYLEAFAHLAHSPGRFCLGPQEDPNHLQPQRHSRYGRRQRGCVTDMFMDDPVCGLQSVLCVISDPRSLMVHGIWDRVPYPGTLIRRPKLVLLPPLERVPCPVEVKLPKLITSAKKLEYYRVQNALDLESLLLVDSWCCSQQPSQCKTLLYPISLWNYLRNIPPPGAGRFPLSTEVATDDNSDDVAAAPQIQELQIEEERSFVASSVENEGIQLDPQEADQNNRNFQAAELVNQMHFPPLNGRPGPRILNLLWVLSAHLGWTVDDNQGAASVYVDRRILIGAQWMSISLMTAPLFWTLIARYARWIPATPVEYPLEALPFSVETELRFLTERECGYVSMLLFFSWLFLGRWIERYTSRDFFRAMLEHMPFDESSDLGILKRIISRVARWWQRKWDAVCPLFLQRMVFVPKWNRRSRNDLLKHVAFWRSQDQAEHR
jgi:hypothetical protein